jgi:hypothetical protein
MTTQTLTRVTLQTLDNYRVAAEQGVTAYRLGTHRLVGAVNGALRKSVYPRTAEVAPRATERMNEARETVSKFVLHGVDRVARNTEKAIEAGAGTAAGQVTRISRFASGIDNPLVAGGLQRAAKLTMPGAKLGLTVSGKLAEGAAALAEAAAGPRARKPAAAAPAPTARRRATKAVKTVRRRAAKVAKATQAEAAKVSRSVRGAGKRVAAAAAA